MSLQKYIYALKIGMQNSIEYRVDFFLGIISIVFSIVIQLFLWTAIYKSTDSSTVYGYNYSQIIMYTLLAGLVTKLVSTGFEYEMNDDIRNGGLNKYIVKPIGYFLFRLSSFIGSKFIAAIVLSVISAAVIAVLAQTLKFQTDFGKVLLFVITLLLSTLLNFLIYYCMSLVAFWVSEVSRLFGTIDIILIVISGGIFPVDIFGSSFLRVINILPFKYTIQFPIDILSGKLSANSIVNGVTLQLSWILSMFLVSQILWRSGMRKYIAAGG